jgi:hypothetical protein
MAMRVATGAVLGGLATCLAWPLPGALAQERGIAVIGKVQQPPKPAVTPIQVSGTFEVQVTLQVSPSLPNGTQISVEVTASTFDSSYSDSVSLTGTATVSTGQASVTLNIPYTWLVASTSDQVTVSAYIYGSANGAAGTYSDSTSWSTTIALPANNATTPVPIATSI